MTENYKEGDIVVAISDDLKNSTGIVIGTEAKVLSDEVSGATLHIQLIKNTGDTSNIRNDWYVAVDHKQYFKLKKQGKKKPDSLIRYMAYGTGCNNRGAVFKTESEMKEELTAASHSDAWTGTIVGYKLVPMYTAKTSTTFTKVRTRKIKKVKK